MEILEAELAIVAETARVLAARNATLPRIDLTGLWNINGAGENLDDSLQATADRDFQDYRLGLSVEVPLGDFFCNGRVIFKQVNQRLCGGFFRIRHGHLRGWLFDLRQRRQCT